MRVWTGVSERHLNPGEGLGWRDEYMNWHMDGGIPLKLLSITAPMNINVWVHMGLFVCVGVHMLVLIMMMTFVPFRHVCDMCA